MTPSIEKKIKDFIESLHKIIRTKEQAERFMKSLRDAGAE